MSAFREPTLLDQLLLWVTIVLILFIATSAWWAT